MNLKPIAVAAIFVISGCSGATDSVKNTVIPTDLNKLETLRPAIESLPQEEKTLAYSWIARHKIPALFAAGKGITEGTTLGQAIEEERKTRQELEKEQARREAEKRTVR